MEYNNNVYLTISHENCEFLQIEGTHRTNNDNTVCILEYPTVESIPTDVAELLIQTYTHEEILTLIEQPEWVSQLPM